MKTPQLSVILFAATLATSGTALADRHTYQVIGEAYGHTPEEAIDNAWRDADTQCYQAWGRSGQEITVLAEWVDPTNGYPTARVSLDCTSED